MTKEELWQAVLAQVQFNVSKANFATWFRNTKIISKEKGKVLVSVENSFSREWLANKYSSFILNILKNLDRTIKNIEFIVKIEKGSFLEKPLEKLKKSKKEETESPQLPFQEFVLDKKTNLNPCYTFDNFIVGGFNELAQAASWAVSEKPGVVYNPLFIYGGVGLGKTHLLQASGNKIVELFSKKKVKYIPSERFISSIIESIRNRTIGELKKKFQELDVLIIDDVQFFAGKEKSQEEFFHIFNILYQNQKQIILSSDRSPKAIPSIEQRLRSRFEGGMMADIGIPDFETRIAILKAKCEEKKIELNVNVLEYISSNIKNNIREIEGALNRLIVFQKINNKSPDLEITKKLLKDLVIIPKKTTNFKKIIQVVSNFYDLQEKDLLSNTRRKEIVKPRQIVMYLLREELNESYPLIGRRFGGKDHTTVIYGWEKINRELKINNDLLTEINLIRQRLYSGF
ncbi:MAG: chromosomal replication initiator protein DnaA [Patescibacteria group bacterium]|nr:chromosomal replication initiator protein DnaA [Patescibacteria group bacterium]